MGAREQVVAEGKKWIGKLNYSQDVRYDFRVDGSADCSSFFQHCLIVGAGVDPGDWTGSQLNHGTQISRSQLQPGDGVFYRSPEHVVLYIGNNQALSHGGGRGPKIVNIDYRSDMMQCRSYVGSGGGSTSGTYRFSTPQIQTGANGVAVLLLQEILKARAIYTGALDRSFGNATAAAVRSYQSSRGLSADGIVGPNTWNDLIALPVESGMYVTSTVSIGSNNNSVLLVQEILKARDFYTGALDKDCGSQTQSAIIAYQKSRNGACGAADGVVGYQTWADMIAL